MLDESKPRIENLEPHEAEGLTPDQAQEAQGGAVDAFIWFDKPAQPTGPQNVSTQKAFEIKDFSFGVENPT